MAEAPVKRRMNERVGSNGGDGEKKRKIRRVTSRTPPRKTDGMDPGPGAMRHARFAPAPGHPSYYDECHESLLRQRWQGPPKTGCLVSPRSPRGSRSTGCFLLSGWWQITKPCMANLAMARWNALAARSELISF